MGVLTGLVLAFIITRIHRLMPELTNWLGTKALNIRHRLTKTSENRLREDTVQHIQHLHLAAPLFSLDEIIIEPRLMLPPLRVDLASEDTYQDITGDVIPYLPDWPELSSSFGAPSLSIAEALSGGASIVITGVPGSGKSTALAYLACQLARKTITVESIKQLVPLFVHILDLPLAKAYKEVREPLTSAISTYVSPLLLPRMNALVHTLLHQKRALLILDGVDELTMQETKPILQWLGELLAQYPGLQVITAALSEDYRGLNRLGIKPLAIAAWDESTVNNFYKAWASSWTEHIAPINPGAFDRVDAMLMTQWLKSAGRFTSPFEATLKAWALFSGDLRSNELPGLIDCHIRRITNQTAKGYQALEHLAVQLIFGEKSSFSNDELRHLVAAFETIIPSSSKETTLTVGEIEKHTDPTFHKARSGKTIPRLISGSQLISIFINHGQFVVHGTNQVRFSHILFLTYLAGRAFARDGNFTALIAQADWYGKWQTLGFAGCQVDISGIVQEQISKTQDDILAIDLSRMARWLSFTPRSAPWRPILIRALAALAQRDYKLDGITARAVCAIGLAHEPAAGILFRQWLQAGNPILQRWGALGCGFVRDLKSVNELASVVEADNIQTAKAACLALAAIGNKAAINALVAILQGSHEQTRRAAAEALANAGLEGIRLLIAGAQEDDLLVRRSVVFGYLRSRLPTLIEVMQHMAVEDDEWLVRNAASHALDIIKKPNPFIPQPSLPVTEIPWLIKFAGKQGIGVQVGKPTRDLIILALQQGDKTEKLFALEYLRQYGDDYAVKTLYDLFQNSDGVIRQAVFDTLLSFAASGVYLPSMSLLGVRK